MRGEPNVFVARNAHTVAVTLDAPTIAACTAFAERIEMANRKNRRKNKQGLTAKGKDSLALRVRGYLGEAALAVYLGLPPARFADAWRAKPDVLCFDCITTDKPHGSLIITPRDRLDMMKVLVIDQSPVFHLCGWYRAGDARTEAERRHSEWWRVEREGGGAWYVPQAFLRSLSDEEAQRELARYGRRFVRDEYNARYSVDVAPVLTPEGEERLMAFARTAAPFARPEDIPDWREVLRRAGAAPPEEQTPTRGTTDV